MFYVFSKYAVFVCFKHWGHHINVFKNDDDDINTWCLGFNIPQTSKVVLRQDMTLVSSLI